MNIQTAGLAFPAQSQLGNSNPDSVPGGLLKELLVSNLLGKYSSLVKAGKVFSAYATLTAPVAFGTAAAIGGPLLWNRPGSGVDAHLLGVSYSLSVASAAAGGLGITGGSGQVAAPTSTTAIDGSGSLLIGGPSPAVSPYRLGTVVNAGGFFVPFAQVHTGALTVDTTMPTFIDLGGTIVVQPGSWASVAGSVVLTTAQIQACLIWAELPA